MRLRDGAGPDANGGAGRAAEHGGVGKPWSGGEAARLFAQPLHPRQRLVGVKRPGIALYAHGGAGGDFAQVGFDLLPELFGVDTRHDAAVDFDVAFVRHDVDLAAARDGADVQAWPSQLRMRMPLEIGNDLLLEELQHVAHGIDGVASLVGCRAVAGDAGGVDLEPERTFVGRDHAELSRFQDQRQVAGKLLFRHGVGAVVAGLLAHEAEETPADARLRPGGTLRPLAQGPQGGSHRSLGVGRTAAEELAVTDLRIEGRDGHAGHADGVEVWREGEMRGGFVRRERSDHVGSARLDLIEADFSAESPQKIGDVLAHGLLAGLFGAGISLWIHARNCHEVL